ncbi:MAG: hypothetical protein ACX93T_04085 [Bacteroidota bacterium]
MVKEEAVPPSPANVDTASTFAEAESALSPLSTMLAFPLHSPRGTFVLASSSGERIKFSQLADKWYAETSKGRLPVESRKEHAAIAPYLKWLASQEAPVVQSRIHILRNNATSKDSFYVYLGKRRVWKDMPASRLIAWHAVPHIGFDGNNAKTVVYDIPLSEGYFFWGCRVCPDSVLDGALCTIYYLETDSQKALNALANYQDARALETRIMTDFTNVVHLGTLSGIGQRTYLRDDQESYGARCRHAALVLHLGLQQQKMPKKPAKVGLQLEIGVVSASSLNTSAFVPIVASAPASAAGFLDVATAVSTPALTLSPMPPPAVSTLYASPVLTPTARTSSKQSPFCSPYTHAIQLPFLNKHPEKARMQHKIHEEVQAHQQLEKQPTRSGVHEEQLKIAGDAQVSARATEAPCQPQIPVEAFGAAAWKQYFGVEVDSEPPLPQNINDILNRKAPFLLEGEGHARWVRDNHLLTLIPGKVDRQDFTLDKLGELVLRYFPDNDDEDFGCNSHGYGYYPDYLARYNREVPLSAQAYWLLLPKTILKDSRSESFFDQKVMLANYVDLGYRLPHVLEVAASVLSHYARSKERLYADHDDMDTYTRCADIDLDGDLLAVGDFSPTGLCIEVYVDDYYDEELGVSCCLEL